MAINNILPFAQGGSALVQTQAAYLADAERAIGHQPGTARPDFANKQMRQVTSMAVGLAQFLADNQGTNVDDTLLGAALSAMIANAIRSVSLMPAGSIIWLPTNVAPAGTLKINGALLVRATYARLWAFAQASGALSGSDALWLSGAEYGRFSPGNGSTTFRMPDLRGYSLKSWDDARGIDGGRAIGTSQLDQNLSHAHGINDPGHAHGVNDLSHTHVAGSQPHSHVLNDPWHNHSMNDPAHAHTYQDPGHGHGVNDPGHAHSYTASLASTPGGAEGGARDAVGGSSASTSANGTGISIAASASGIIINPSATGVSSNAGPTGMSMNATTTTVAVNASFSNISVTAAGSGVSVAANGGNEVRVKNIALMPVMFF